ncbi:hypothetical protein ACFFRR_005919 [Megaselia abdita]
MKPSAKVRITTRVCKRHFVKEQLSIWHEAEKTDEHLMDLNGDFNEYTSELVKLQKECELRKDKCTRLTDESKKILTANEECQKSVNITLLHRIQSYNRKSKIS